MTKWQTKLMRWGVLLLLCYGAMLIQLSKLRHHDTNEHHHEKLSSRLAANFTALQKFRDPPSRQEETQLSAGTRPSPLLQDNVGGNKTRRSHLYTCVLSNGRRKKLPRVPNFIIGGSQKGGTTALMRLIKMHPLIVDSLTFEAHFFDYDEAMRNLKRFASLDEHALCDLRVRYGMKHFPLRKLMDNPELLSFEKTPAYILEESIPAKIKAITPWSKVIFSLRNPIDRAFSHYKMIRTRNQIGETNSFEDVLATDLKVLRRRNFTIATGEPFPEVENLNPRRMHQLWKAKNLIYRGLYVDQLAPWLEHFTLGKDLLVVQFERMFEHPHNVLDEILDFLGVHRHSYDQAHFNESYSPVVASEKHELNDATRDYLLRLYKPYNQKLADLLGAQWQDVWNTTHY